MVYRGTTERHQDICSASWWDSKLFNALIHPKLWPEPPGGCGVLHQQLPAPFINLMGFIFLTLAIYQAEAAWWGGGGGAGGIKFPIVCCGSTGKPLIHGLSSFSHHSFPFLSFPITPCCCGPPLSSPSSLHASLWLLFSLSLLRLLFLSPSPPPPSHDPRLNCPLPSPPCIAGLWGRRLPVHHQGDNHPHGKLQLPCLRLWRRLSDTCAAGEWSVEAISFFKLWEKCGQNALDSVSQWIFCSGYCDRTDKYPVTLKWPLVKDN